MKLFRIGDCDFDTENYVASTLPALVNGMYVVAIIIDVPSVSRLEIQFDDLDAAMTEYNNMIEFIRAQQVNYYVPYQVSQLPSNGVVYNRSGTAING